MSYTFSRTVTIDHTKCGSANSTNFTALFSGTYTYLKTVGNGGDVQNSNGYDIAFFSDAGLTTPLSWEVESYNAATGAIIAWVKIPTLSASVDTVIYLAYGDSGISTFQGGSTGAAWDSNFTGVWHLPNGTTLSANDSTTTGANGSLINTVTATTGKVDGGAQFSGTNGYISFSRNSTLDNMYPVTWEAWVNPTSGDLTSSANGSILTSYRTSSSSSDYFDFSISGSGAGGTQGRIRVAWYDTVAPYVDFISNTGLSASTWYHLAFTLDTSGAWVIYINGAVDRSGSANSHGPVINNTNTLLFGADPDIGSNAFYAGILDEVRLAKTARSSSWVTSNYNSQNSPSTFYSVGGTGGASAPVQPLVWPNPLTLKLPTLSPQGAFRGLLDAVQPYPLNQYNWPLPLGARSAVVTAYQPNRALLDTVYPRPPAQPNWPVPQGRLQPNHGQPQGQTAAILRYVYGCGAINDVAFNEAALNVGCEGPDTLGQGIPFSQLNWPLPLGARSPITTPYQANRGLLDAVPPTPLPPHQTDWPVPLGARSALPTTYQPNRGLLDVVNVRPPAQPIWPVPRAARAPDQTAVLGSPILWKAAAITPPAGQGMYPTTPAGPRHPRQQVSMGCPSPLLATSTISYRVYGTIIH